MKNTAPFTLAFAILLLAASCSPNLVPFTKKMQDDNGWTDAQLREIQFFTSNDIILQRKSASGSSTIESGTITMVDGKEVEQIVIKKGTKGVAVVFPKEGLVGVSFEIDDSHFLTFGVNPKRDGQKFYLMAKEWNNKIGKVTYNSEPFYTSPRSYDTFLMVDLRKIRKYKTDERVAKGRDVR